MKDNTNLKVLETLDVDIDVSKNSNQTCILTFNGEKLCNFSSANNSDGAIIYNDYNYKEFYRKKFNEVTTHQHSPLVLITKKLIRLIYGLMSKDQLYNCNNNHLYNIFFAY